MTNHLFESHGIIHYDNSGQNLKLIVEVDQSIADYYRALCPKWLKIKPQKYGAHISVVRNEVPPNIQYWNKYEGKDIKFFYENFIYGGQVYYWLNVFCTELEDVRAELGLAVTSEYTRPPEGFLKCFHMTIGNVKSI